MKNRSAPGLSGLRRTLALILAAVLGTGLLAACGSSEARSLLTSIRNGHVIAGTKYDQPGLGVREPDKEITGFDADVSRYVVSSIAKKLGVPEPEISWKETPSAQRENLISNGEVDMIAATYSINDSRSKRVDFGGPYLVTYQALLVRADDNQLQTLEDMNAGRRLCSVTGSTSAQNVQKQLPAVQLQQFDSYSSCVEAVYREKVDALTTDATILAGFAAQYPGEFKLVEMNNVSDVMGDDGKVSKKAGSPFSTERYGIGVTKGDKATVDAINEALDEMISSGAWNEAFMRNVGNSMRDSGYPVPEPPTPGDLSFLS
ncbi:glutamate ABC transporter substrate-binding protein [Dietzia sp.]|uniref:glutamate ABC transporter substrate-binding protein n=1 Tax=Dietzia sp. TaxID=1871616 RepID=UPI002FDAB430